MIAVIIMGATAAVACPFLARLRWARVSAAHAYHAHVLAAGAPMSTAAMLAAISSLSHRRVRPPLVMVHRYRREGSVRLALSVVSRHPQRVAELIAAAAGGRTEPCEVLDIPPLPAIRYARRGRGPDRSNDVSPVQFGGWIDSVLGGADVDAILSVGVTPAARWEDEGNDAPLRSRILAGAGDPVTAGALAAGCGAHLPGRVSAFVARRPGDSTIVAAGGALAVGAGMTVAAGAAVAGHVGTAAGAVEGGWVAAAAIAGVAALRLVRITEGCWRQALRGGIVVPPRPWRLARRTEPTTRRTVNLSVAHLAALCTPPTGTPPTGAPPTVDAPLCPQASA